MEVYHVVFSVLPICVQALVLYKSTVQTKILVFMEKKKKMLIRLPSLSSPYRLQIVQKLEKRRQL